MSDNHVDEGKGRMKEAVGSLTDDESLKREGRSTRPSPAPGSCRQSLRGLEGREFFDPGSRDAARRKLGIAPREPLVLISGGGWGAGDLTGALGAYLQVPDAQVIVVSGRNERLRRELTSRYSSQPRVCVIGFTECMRDLMWAADAFVSATAGLSCVEARLCGCPTVAYGFAVDHVRDNTRALAQHGLIRDVADIDGLYAAVRMSLQGGRTPIPPVDQLPDAAELTASLASAGAMPRSHPGVASVPTDPMPLR